MPFFTLILLQVVWTSSYVAMKIALAAMPVGLVLVGRIGSATLLLMALGFFRGASRFTKRDWLLMASLGVLTFALSPFFQLKSLQLTNVIDVSALVSAEPLITALIASFLLRERITWDMAIVFVIAAIGVMILSGVSWERLESPMTSARLVGNFLFLGSMCLEGTNSAVGRHLSQKHPPLKLMAWMMGFGFLATLFFFGPSLTIESVQQVPIKGWIAVVYLGLFCSVIGYGAWYLLLQKIQVSRLALSLFLQPVFGLFFGALLMGERLDRQTVMGAGLIIITLFAWVLKNIRGQKGLKI